MNCLIYQYRTPYLNFLYFDIFIRASSTERFENVRLLKHFEFGIIVLYVYHVMFGIIFCMRYLNFEFCSDLLELLGMLNGKFDKSRNGGYGIFCIDCKTHTDK